MHSISVFTKALSVPILWGGAVSVAATFWFNRSCDGASIAEPSALASVVAVKCDTDWLSSITTVALEVRTKKHFGSVLGSGCHFHLHVEMQ